MQQDTWVGCYASGWQGVCVPAAFAHPAKYSKSLIFKIIQHAMDEGFVTKGATVFDPFAGVSLGSLPCNLLGLHWCGIELEEKFWQLSQDNIALWKVRYGIMPGYGTAVCLHGDSRRLLEVLAGAVVSCCITSPPYVDCLTNGHSGIDTSKGIDPRHPESQSVRRLEELAEGYGSTEGNLGNLPAGPPPPTCIASSPPYVHGLGKEHTYADHAKRENDSHRRIMTEKHIADPFYGTEPAQLGNMAEGHAPAMIVTSPPFEQSIAGGSGVADRANWFRDRKTKGGKIGQSSNQGYGTTPGQLAGMHVTAPSAIVASPPYEGSMHPNEPWDQQVSRLLAKGNSTAVEKGSGASGWGNQGYSPDAENLGTTHGDTFWEASKIILSQCFQLLPIGGHAIFVVKSYIKDGAIVDFPGQWAALCNSVGLRVIHEHRAVLTTHHGTQEGLFGETTTHSTKRVSFFRRLHEMKRPDLAIDWESVLCCIKEQ